MMSKAIAIVLVALAVQGCVETQYVPYGEEQKPTAEPIAARQVFYRIEQAFYDSPPDCVLVLSPVGPEEVGGLLEGALARHMSGRVPRVIGPAERRRDERALAFDLGDEADQRRYAKSVNCAALLRPKITNLENGMALVWSGRRFGAALELIRATDGALLWQASHATSRSDGGVPLSPLSLPMTVFNALRFGQDTDQFPSMVDDAVRRMVVTLPDMR